MYKYVSLLLLLIWSNTFAANAWYWGGVTSINTLGSDGIFQIYLDNPSVQAMCSHDRVDFRASEMGAERTKAALSMALTAFSAGKQWGVVIDLPTNESIFKASSTANQGAEIQ